MRVLEGRYLDRADPEKGRFRSFILTSLKFFAADEQDRQRAQKRGGGAVVSLEFSSGESGEERYQREPGHDDTPDRIFERRWALSMLERVMERLREEFVQHGSPENFERKGVSSRSVRSAICRPGPRNDHIRRSPESSHPQASQTLSRALSPRNRGHCRRSRRSGVRTAVSGGCAHEEVVAQRSTCIRTRNSG
jgi:hypothetical protein